MEKQMEKNWIDGNPGFIYKGDGGSAGLYPDGGGSGNIYTEFV